MLLYQQSSKKIYDVVYENRDLLIVNKPFFLPTATGADQSLCDYLFLDYPEVKETVGFNSMDGGLLNRLDNETGGLVLFARNSESFNYFRSVLNKESVSKYYSAIIDGVPPKKSGIIDKKITHHRKNAKKMIIVENGVNYRKREREAFTEWTLIDSYEGHSLLDIKISRGVRHQIRLHLSSIGFPIVNDKLYNSKTHINPLLPHFLFSYRVTIPYYDSIIDVSIETPFSLIKNRK